MIVHINDLSSAGGSYLSIKTRGGEEAHEEGEKERCVVRTIRQLRIKPAEHCHHLFKPASKPSASKELTLFSYRSPLELQLPLSSDGLRTTVLVSHT